MPYKCFLPFLSNLLCIFIGSLNILQSKPHSYILFISFSKTGKKNAVIKFTHSEWILPMLHFELGRNVFLIALPWLDFWTFLSFVLWLSIQTILNFQDMLLDFITSWMHTSVLYFKNPAGFLRLQSTLYCECVYCLGMSGFVIAFTFLLRSYVYSFLP